MLCSFKIDFKSLIFVLFLYFFLNNNRCWFFNKALFIRLYCSLRVWRIRKKASHVVFEAFRFDILFNLLRFLWPSLTCRWLYFMFWVSFRLFLSMRVLSQMQFSIVSFAASMDVWVYCVGAALNHFNHIEWWSSSSWFLLCFCFVLFYAR